MCPLLFAIETLFVLPLIVAAAVNIVIVSAALTITVPLNVVSLALVSLKPTLVKIVIVKVLWCPVLIVGGKLFFRIATIVLVILIIVSVVGGLVTLSHLHLNLPLVKRTLTIHLLDSLKCLFQPRKLNVRKPTTIPSLVILNHVNRLNRTVSRKDPSDRILGGTMRYPCQVNVKAIVFLLLLSSIVLGRGRP